MRSSAARQSQVAHERYCVLPYRIALKTGDVLLRVYTDVANLTEDRQRCSPGALEARVCKEGIAEAVMPRHTKWR